MAIDFRCSSRAHAGWLALLALVLPACGGGGGSAVGPPPPPPSLTITKVSTAPNPTGLKIGFWEVRNRQAATVPLAGPRPIARVGFETWSRLETAPGVYAQPDAGIYQASHLFGEQIEAAVNISFTDAMVPGNSTIPAFYAQDITDPVTRAAALRFLRFYVQSMLSSVGSLVLTIDYEIVSNWVLEGTDAGRDARAATWAAWYVEAAGVARQAAADIGMSAQLTLQPIVNGDPLSPGSPMGTGAAKNAWLRDVVAVSDALAIDTYHSDPNRPVTDPSYVIATIAYWINNFAGGKPVNLTENGFTTITQQDPTITRAQRAMKYTGTEQQQADYYRALFAQLRTANKAAGLFGNRLRSFSMWSNIDNAAAGDPGSIYFGLIRLDGSEKPAAAVVRSALDSLESDPFSRPWNAVGAGVDVTAAMATGVDLVYSAGDSFDFLHYVDPAMPAGSRCHLTGSMSRDGGLAVAINGHWIVRTLPAGPFDLDLGVASCRMGALNTVDVRATGAVHPFAQTISGLALSTQ